ncbi:hypothetical protein DICPUDRAFT_147546 [Dictyostelium purpureum]|uniref:C2H2-type domain-containing protein n=1 Tax=Dictyostelium purpureum TaxID=5786 RepID=F0Z8S3_DICPU|nr:uncharacterized protein DICPUDRAFT_147546 [Dictyostelium purpureum]EGC39709.1 hypothetical protein DICPUDRAFT_147546 [Dictyostelium purpureum]|eukprot:XP_003283818.1 hypothetical protein DICPUDRAFT_147546 [Dictyostelium purpureum]
MKSNKNKSNNKKENTNNSNNNNVSSYEEVLSKLPSYSLEVYENDCWYSFRQNFKELILEPLSLLTSGDVIVVSTIKSPKNSNISNNNNNNNNNNDNNSDDSDDEDNNDGDQDDSDGEEEDTGSSNNQYYCPFCKKRFQTEQTWNTHINSSKHLKAIKDQKKKTTSLNLTPTKASPNKNNSNNNNNNNNNISSKDSDFLLEQINLIQQSIKIKNTKPNLACKNLFNVAKSYSSRQYIRDSAKTLYILLDVLKSQQQTTESPTLNNIFQTASLSCKTNLYIARLTRLFQASLSEHHYIQAFLQLSLVSNEDFTKYENIVSLSSNITNLYKVFLNKINILLKEIKKKQQEQAQQAQQEQQENTIENKVKEEGINQDDEKIQTILNYLNEIAGGLCYCKVSFKSVVVYLLATCIGYKFKKYRESLQSNQRALKLLVSLKQYHWSIDLYLNNILIILKIKKQLQQSQSQQSQQPQSQQIQEKEKEEYNNLIKDNLIKIFKYCYMIQDKARLKYILDNENIKKIFNLKQFKNDEQLLCLKQLSTYYLQDSFDEIDSLKDQYEHIIFTNKEFIFIFNQFFIINNNRLIIN